uniref:ATP synthase F0 subunit 8 n=1 Tax=Sergentia baueri TaxID=134687 RepID=UPI0023F16347|nr:ATP synthase F0 subunit 8 [Sergentia baueri]WEF49668.1 ATP synthase F0 subunit 8 [Sergentia baueri]
MPQMSPMMWSILFLIFTLLFMFFNILNYFNFSPTYKLITIKSAINTENKQEIKKFLIWKW